MYVNKLEYIFNKYNNTYTSTINPIQDGGWAKENPSNFLPVTSGNVGISHQNILIFSFKLFGTLM